HCLHLFFPTRRSSDLTGSFIVSSKLGIKSTVSFFISLKSSEAIFESRVSVYLMAAGGSPSMLPLLPCISISSLRTFQSWLNLTRSEDHTSELQSRFDL